MFASKPALTLDSQSEKDLIEAIERGQVARLSTPPPEKTPHSVYLLKEKPRPRIRASLLRDLLLGVPVANGKDEAQPIEVTSFGVRLWGASIEGKLELDDLGHEGSLRTRLEFRYCWFDEPVHLKRARLTSLTFGSCNFQELMATDCVIDGPLEVSGARSSARDGTCQC